MKLTSDKILYLVIVSGIVAYMLLNHGNIEFNEEEIDIAIREGQAEERSSDDDSDLSPEMAKVAILKYLKDNKNSLQGNIGSFINIFQKLTDDKEHLENAMDLVGKNDYENLKNYIVNL
tara:strand:+ start:876 stop:1232 length:357 start_codon:yes stop_codon:yes gene_type:complete